MSSEVVFLPMGGRAAAREGRSLLDLAQSAGVPLVGACGGKGVCGKCLVRPEDPEAPASPRELELLGQAAAKGMRLACQVSLPRGGRVWVPEESLSSRQVILTAGEGATEDLDPLATQVRVEVLLPTLEDPAPASLRLARALARAGIFSAPLSLPLLRDLPPALARGKGRLTVTLHRNRRVLDLAPEPAGPCLGLAVDLGTTTLAAYLLDLKTGRALAVRAAVNPQIACGGDVISRITYFQRGPEEAARLSGLAVECVNRLAREASAESGVSPRDIQECVMVGNTAMHHIFLGLDPSGLAQAPYAPVTGEGLELAARDLGLELAPEARLAWLPVKAGFVGADTVAVALALEADRLERPTLILDLGTNGEMILAARGRLACCSTAAGPAFEGGHIHQGMRGGPGAVERAEVDPVTLAPRLQVIGGGRPAGICGSGLVSLAAALLRTGALTPRGAFAPDLPGDRVRPGLKGMEYLIAGAAETATGRDLVLTSADVAELQLAKAAIRAGAEMLMERLGIGRLDQVLLAGAFGNYLDPEEARSLGLFPDIEPGGIRGVGNAAGTGAVRALLSGRARARAQELAGRMEYLELSGHPDFQERFLDAMPFPGGDDEP